MSVARCRGPVNRRQFLRVGSLALGGASLSDVLAGRAAAGAARTDTSVILCYLHGGPSQLETYDLKPQAPVETRSVFDSIPTVVPGMVRPLEPRPGREVPVEVRPLDIAAPRVEVQSRQPTARGDIDALDQTEQQLASCFVPDIQGDRPLAAIRILE